MTRGGKREGAGRKHGVRNKSTMQVKDLLDKCVDFEVVVGKLYELAQGVEVEKYVKDENVVYSEKPDAFAAKVLLEYRFGKPQQSVDITTKGQEIKNVIRLTNGTEITI